MGMGMLWVWACYRYGHAIGMGMLLVWAYTHMGGVDPTEKALHGCGVDTALLLPFLLASAHLSEDRTSRVSP